MAKKPELKPGETNARPIPRCMLYNETGSQLFVGREDIDAALEDGWDTEPVTQTAQSAVAGASAEANAKIAELDEFLQQASDEADEANAKAAAATLRAETAEKDLATATKQLAAAEKKLAANASK